MATEFAVGVKLQGQRLIGQLAFAVQFELVAAIGAGQVQRQIFQYCIRTTIALRIKHQLQLVVGS